MMRSSDSDSEASGHLAQDSLQHLQPCTTLHVGGLDDLGVSSVQLARFRAARRQKAAAEKIRESESRARALAVGSATEELRREQKKRKKAAERAKHCEAALEDAESSLKQLQYTNHKLEQQLASIEAAARIAAECSSRSLRNLRDALCNVEADTADKFAQGQQQVQCLIALTKQLQLHVISSNSSNGCSSPTHRQQHPYTNSNATDASSKATQAISSIFQALAALGTLLVPSPGVLQDADSAFTASSPKGTAHIQPKQDTQGPPWGGMVPVPSDLATSAAGINCSSSKDASCLAAQLAICEARLQDLSAGKAALQHRCNALQRQCDESQQKLHRQAGSCAELCHESQVESAQHLAEVASLQAEKLQLQTEVETLRQSLQSAQSALQSLRDQHEQQISRLANANAEVLRLRSHISKLENELRQQQQDAASALCIVSGREATGAIVPATAATGSAAAGGGGRRSPSRNLLSSLARPGSAAAAAVGCFGGPYTAAGINETVSSEQGPGYSNSFNVYSEQQHKQQGQQGPDDVVYEGNSTVLGAAAKDATHQTLGQKLLQQLHQEKQQRHQQEHQWQHGLASAASTWDGPTFHTTTTFGMPAGSEKGYNPNAYVLKNSDDKADYWSSSAAANQGATAAAGSACSLGVRAAMPASLPPPQQQQQQQGATGTAQPTQNTHQESYSQAGAATAWAGGRPQSTGSMLNYANGVRAADSISQQHQQQYVTAAERHRALVADADATLARLAACRRAAAAASPTIGTVPRQVGRGGVGVSSSLPDSAGHGRFAGSRHTVHPVPVPASVSISSNADRHAAAGVDTGRHTADWARQHHSASQLADRAGVADLLGTRYLDRAGRHNTAASSHSPAQTGGHVKPSQQTSIKLQELQQELDELDDDFAHAEAQLQAAAARLSGNAALC